MPTIRELLRSVFVELLAIAVVASVSLLLLGIGIGKVEANYVAIILVVATIIGIAVYRLGGKHFRFLAASRSGTGPLCLFTNQLECKDEIVENFKTAKSVKILTARGGRYFGIAGWFYSVLGQKKGRNDQMQILVCSSESPHIDKELARQLGYSSVEAVKDRMCTSLIHLGALARDCPNMSVRVYAEKPVWNILLFDDLMYVAPYVEHESHERATALKFKRHVKSHFVGFESHFDQLWCRSKRLEEFLADSDLPV